MPISYRAAQTLIKRDKAEELQAALEGGLDPNLRNENGWTLLMLAAVEGSAAIGKLLLDKGADPTKRNASQQSAENIASARRHEEFLTLLQRHESA